MEISATRTNGNKIGARDSVWIFEMFDFKCECYHCRQDADNEVFMELVKWQQEFNAWEQEDIFFEQCLSTTEKEFFFVIEVESRSSWLLLS